MRTYCEDWDSEKPQYLTDKRTGKTIGILQPVVTQRVLEASIGIATWSQPGGKADVTQDDAGSVANFAAHWERRYKRTYPFAREEA